MGCGASRAVAQDPAVFLVAHEPMLPRLVDGDGARALALEPVASSRFVGEWRQLYGSYTIVEDAAHAVALGEAVAATLVPVGVPVGNTAAVPPAAADAPEPVSFRSSPRGARLAAETKAFCVERVAGGRDSSGGSRDAWVLREQDGEVVGFLDVSPGWSATRCSCALYATAPPPGAPADQPPASVPAASAHSTRPLHARARFDVNWRSFGPPGWKVVLAAAGGAFSGATFVGEFDAAGQLAFTSAGGGDGGGREPRRGAALILPEEEGGRTRVRVAEGVDALLFACVAAVHRRLHDLTKPEEAG